VLLHIVPDSGAYGPPLLGLHLYAWCLVVFLVAIAAVAFLLLVEKQFATARSADAPYWVRGAAMAMMAVTGLSAISSFVQCGLTECADNPTSYWLFRGLDTTSSLFDPIGCGRVHLCII
jgi:hypothetical protein